MRPALRYFGGKWRLAPWIISHFPGHRCYVEPFGGGASVLLRKPRARVEVYNDIADSVVNFFRVLRGRHDELVRLLELTPFALSEYIACRDQAGDDVERARRFFVRSWGGHHGVNGSGRNRGWRRTPDRDVAGQMSSAVDSLHETAARLRGVAIECTDWRRILDRYDRPDTLFYLDPPYVIGTRKCKHPSDGYGEQEFTDHEELLERAKAARGMVVISGYDNQLYSGILADWRRVERTQQPQHGSRREVLWITE